jgi:hypothetical protein
MYRELADQIVEDPKSPAPLANHERVLRECEAAIRRLATDRYYFARPARSLFNQVRVFFPIPAQRRVFNVITTYMGLAEEYVRAVPASGYDLTGSPLRCRASTRKGTPCQRTPLPRNGYCPSHQHLAESEDLAA